MKPFRLLVLVMICTLFPMTAFAEGVWVLWVQNIFKFSSGLMVEDWWHGGTQKNENACNFYKASMIVSGVQNEKENGHKVVQKGDSLKVAFGDSIKHTFYQCVPESIDPRPRKG